MEEWMDIPGFDNYEVSDHGNVRNKNTERILRTHELGKGLIVTLYQGGRSHTKRVARLVAEAFSIEVVNSSMIVSQKDGDIHNNHIDNLDVYYRGVTITVKGYDHLGNLVYEY